MLLIYLLLGAIQGFTEPIPVSSSGHIIIFKNLFNTTILNDLNFEIFVNFGSFIAIVYIFKNEIIQIIKDFINYTKTKNKKYQDNFTYTLLIIAGTIPAGLIGILLKDPIEKYLSYPKFVGIALLITAFFLFLIRKQKGYKKDNQITYIDAIKIGLFQAFALIPGISRSGATIVGGMLTNLKRETAFKFSFMLYIPITIATIFLSVKDLIQTNQNLIIYYILGLLSSMIVTYYSTNWFKNIMLKGKLIYFIIYCLIAGIITILLF